MVLFLTFYFVSLSLSLFKLELYLFACMTIHRFDDTIVRHLKYILSKAQACQIFIMSFHPISLSPNRI